MVNKALINIPDFIKISVMAFAFIWVVNRGLSAAGLDQYKA